MFDVTVQKCLPTITGESWHHRLVQKVNVFKHNASYLVLLWIYTAITALPLSKNIVFVFYVAQDLFYGDFLI